MFARNAVIKAAVGKTSFYCFSRKTAFFPLLACVIHMDTPSHTELGRDKLVLFGQFFSFEIWNWDGITPAF